MTSKYRVTITNPNGEQNDQIMSPGNKLDATFKETINYDVLDYFLGEEDEKTIERVFHIRVQRLKD